MYEIHFYCGDSIERDVIMNKCGSHAIKDEKKKKTKVT